MTLVFSLHYFLWYGALTSIFSYESVYARHYTRASAAQYGFLNMILPFVTVLVTPIICSMADRRRSHRSFFTITQIMTLVAFCLHSALPMIFQNHPAKTNDPERTLLIGPWVYYCFTCLLGNIAMAINTCLSDSFAVLQAEETGTSFGRIIVWGTFGWALSGLVLGFINQLTWLPRLVPGLLYGTVLLTIDSLMVSLWSNNSDFKLDTIPVKAAQTLTSSSASLHKEPSDYQPSNESALINLGTEITSHGTFRRRTKSPVKIMIENEQIQAQVNKAAPVVKTVGLKSPEVNVTDVKPTTAVSAISVISDDLGSSIKTINSGYDSDQNQDANLAKVNDVYNSLGNNTNERLDKVIKVLHKKEDEKKRTTASSFRLQLIMLCFILRKRRSLVRFLILFILSGFFMSMHWNYFFLFLEELHGKRFEIATAVSMVGQSIIGELPFFILSRKVIDLFGRSYTLSISFITIGLRFILYAYFLPNVSLYLVLVADCLQGPNYGLFYVVMTEVGLEYSYCDDETIDMLANRGDLDKENKEQVDSVRLLLKSTIQSVAFASYEGIGLGLGSIVGGFTLVHFKFKTLWATMAVAAISVGLINIIIEFACREDDLEADSSERGEFVQAKRHGLLEQMASPVVALARQPEAEQSTNPGQLADRVLAARMIRKSSGKPVAPPAATISRRTKATTTTGQVAATSG